MRLKILTYNIHKGFNWNKSNYFLADIKELVKKSEANLVFLQEIVGKDSRYQKKGLIDSQFEYMADSIWSHYSYAQNAIYDHGHHGNLILSEFPIASTKNIDISTNYFEKRGLLVCKISLQRMPNDYLYVICIHLDVFNRGRHKQYKMLKDLISSLGLSDQDPLVVAGDFNDWTQEASQVLETELKMIEVYKFQYGSFAKTFPAFFPFLSLDRIYVRNIRIIQAQVISKIEKHHFSDHLPLLCEVELNET